MIQLQGTTVSSGVLASATSHIITLPTGITAGELLCIYCLTNSDIRKATAVGYTAVDFSFSTGSTTSHTLLFKEADGTESGDITLTLAPVGSATQAVHAFRLSGVDTADPFNSNNYTSLTEGSSTATPSIAASTLTSAAGSGFLVAISSEANRDVTSFDADLDTEIGSTAAAISLHVFLDEVEAGTANPQYDFIMSSGRQYNEAIFELKSAAAGGLTLDSAPTTMAKAETGLIFTVTDPATTPTAGNISAVAGSASLTPVGVTNTAGTTWDLEFDCSVDVAKQAGSYAWTVTVDAENVVSSSIPLTVQSGWTNIVLASPLTTVGYMLNGFTGDTPVTGDSMEFETTTDLNPGLDSEWIWNTAPTVTQVVARRVIQVDGTVGDTADVTFVVDDPVVDSGILRNILRSPLKDILRNPIK